MIELPAVTPPETAGSDGDANALPASRRGAILVVDDEQVVAQTLADALRLDGHETAIAGNGAVALDMLAKGQYDLIVSDSKMPVLDGEAFYDELSRRFPALRERVIFVTGDLLSREKREFLARANVPFIAKPCDLGHLRRTVREMLASAGTLAGP